MEHVKALMVKFILALILNYVILGLFFDVSFANVFWLTLILGVVSYLIGDVMLLPRTNNLLATISDFAIALLISWFYLSNVTYNDGNAFIASLTAAIAMAVFEWFFHKYMVSHVLHDHHSTQGVNKLRYQTEASEEITPFVTDDKKDRE